MTMKCNLTLAPLSGSVAPAALVEAVHGAADVGVSAPGIGRLAGLAVGAELGGLAAEVLDLYTEEEK
jgi:hypothetical protein